MISRKFHVVLFWLIVILGFAMIYFTEFSSAAKACKAAGGSYFLNGECAKFEMKPVTPVNL